MSNTISNFSSIASLFTNPNKSNTQPLNPTTFTKNFLSNLDTNGDGVLVQSEFEEKMGQTDSTDNKSSSNVQAVFETFDKDGSGTVTESEISTTLGELAKRFQGSSEAGGTPPPPPPPAETSSETTSSSATTTSSTNPADSNGDGKVSMAEFLEYYQSNQTSNTTTNSVKTSTTSGTGEISFAEQLRNIVENIVTKLTNTYGASSKNNESSQSTVNLSA